MTIQELIDWCNSNNVSLNTHIAVRAKDDYYLTASKVSMDLPYFGNCRDGMRWMQDVANRDEDGCIDYDSIPNLLILNSE